MPQNNEHKFNAADKAVQLEAHSKLNEWIKLGLADVQVLKECKWKIDEAVSFNSKKDKAMLLLLIQDNLKHAELDYVYIMYAALEKGKWVVYFAGMPNVVFPRKRPGGAPTPFSELSERGQAELTRAYSKPNGELDDNILDQTFTDGLKAKQAKFLQKR